MTSIGSNALRCGLAALALALAAVASGCAVEPGDAASGEAQAAPADDTAALDTSVATQDLAEATCGHSICDTGGPVSSTCDRCVINICRVDPFCCATEWDSICVGEVSSVCGQGPLAVTGSTAVSQIKVRISTGGDDLRDGSQAYGSFLLSSGITAPSPHVSLNGGARFADNTVNIATINLSPARTLGSFSSFTLEWDGAPRRLFDSYDNWNADQMQFFLDTPGRCPTTLGAPISPGRVTGSRTVVTLPVHFP